MFKNLNLTYSYISPIRVFTLSNSICYTSKTISWDNQKFIGDEIIITFNN